MINFQSRIHIYKSNFFYLKFFYRLIISKIFKSKSDIVQLKNTLKNKFKNQNVHLVGQCREGIYYTVKYSILMTKKHEVIVSSYTLYHVINMILLAGGTPVFVDLEKNNLHNSYQKILKKINQNTACIIITHLFYVNEEIDEIKKIASEKNIYLLEDCAVGFGTKNINNVLCGNFGDFGIFSFQAMKNVQSLTGGAIITKNEDFSKWIEYEMLNLKEISFYEILKKLLFVFCIDFLTRIKFVNFIFFQILKIAYKKNISSILKLIRADHTPTSNLMHKSYDLKKMTNAQAAFINIGINNMDKDQKDRLKRALIYQHKLEKFKVLQILPKKGFNNRNHLEYPVLVKEKEALFNFLLKNNIDVRKFYYRNLSYLDCYDAYNVSCPNSNNVENQIITLPCYPSYSLKNIYKITRLIKEFYKIHQIN